MPMLSSRCDRPLWSYDYAEKDPNSFKRICAVPPGIDSFRLKYVACAEPSWIAAASRRPRGLALFSRVNPTSIGILTFPISTFAKHSITYAASWMDTAE